MTVSGYIAAHAIPGSFNAMSFYDFIAEEVVHMGASPTPLHC